MPLMGSFYVGNSGLQTSQNALNTTAHNITNADTKGYVRQQALIGDKEYNQISVDTSGISAKQTGLGVTYQEVRQVRTFFLIKRTERKTADLHFILQNMMQSAKWKIFSEKWTEQVLKSQLMTFGYPFRKCPRIRVHRLYRDFSCRELTHSLPMLRLFIRVYATTRIISMKRSKIQSTR